MFPIEHNDFVLVSVVQVINDSHFQYNTYNAVLISELKGKIGGLLTGTSQAGNIVFPTKSKKVFEI